MDPKTKQARTGDADLLEMMLPAGCEQLFLIKNPSLTQAKAAFHAGLIRPEFADLVALLWAQIHLGSEALPW